MVESGGVSDDKGQSVVKMATMMAEKITPARKAPGAESRLDGLPCCVSLVSMMANIRSTDIAPTYIRTWATARKSACRIMYMPATARKDNMRNSEARKISRRRTTAAEEITAREARIQKGYGYADFHALAALSLSAFGGLGYRLAVVGPAALPRGALRRRKGENTLADTACRPGWDVRKRWAFCPGLVGRPRGLPCRCGCRRPARTPSP